MAQRRARGVELPDNADFEECKVVGHNWERFHPIMDTPRYGARISLRCTRCTSERHDTISRNSGWIEGRKYDYAEGYIAHYDSPDDRPSKSDLRLSMVERLQNELAAHDALGMLRSKEEVAQVEQAQASVTPIRSRRAKASA